SIPHSRLSQPTRAAPLRAVCQVLAIPFSSRGLVFGPRNTCLWRRVDHWWLGIRVTSGQQTPGPAERQRTNRQRPRQEADIVGTAHRAHDPSSDARSLFGSLNFRRRIIVSLPPTNIVPHAK